MSFVVSRNYRDLNSDYKWLVRSKDDPPESPRACKRVVATDVHVSQLILSPDGSMSAAV